MVMPMELRVRNTFIELVEDENYVEQQNAMRRVKSESDISTGGPPSHDDVTNWRNGWTSSSAQSSHGGESGQCTPQSLAFKDGQFTPQGIAFKDPTRFSSNDTDVTMDVQGNRRDDNLPPPSIGSILHTQGKCKPCHYAFIKKGCANAEKCEFCHYSHQHLKKRRPCKEQRDGYKRLIAAMDGAQDPMEAVQKALGQCDTKPYLKNKLVEKLKQLQSGDQLCDQQPNSPLAQVCDEDWQMNYGSPTHYGYVQEPPYHHAVPPMSGSHMPQGEYGTKPEFKNTLTKKLKKLQDQNRPPQQQLTGTDHLICL
jgi:hypothetical protein